MSLIDLKPVSGPPWPREEGKIRWFSSILSYLQILKKKWLFIFLLELRITSSSQMCCNPTICFKIWVIKLSQPLPNFKIQSSRKEEVGSYDNIALGQRNISLKNENKKTWTLNGNVLQEQCKTWLTCFDCGFDQCNWEPDFLVNTKVKYNMNLSIKTKRHPLKIHVIYC